MTNYDIQITAVHDRKGGMIETKYVASIKDKKWYVVRAVSGQEAKIKN